MNHRYYPTPEHWVRFEIRITCSSEITVLHSRLIDYSIIGVLDWPEVQRWCQSPPRQGSVAKLWLNPNANKVTHGDPTAKLKKRARRTSCSVGGHPSRYWSTHNDSLVVNLNVALLQRGPRTPPPCDNRPRASFTVVVHVHLTDCGHFSSSEIVCLL